MLTSCPALSLTIRKGPPPILSIIEPTQNLLLDYKDLADFDDEVELRSSLFKQYGFDSVRGHVDFWSRYQKALLSTQLLPAHVYVLSIRALKILEAIPTFQSIKEDFVPFLAKLQWQTPLLRKYSDSAFQLTVS
jgi:translation initiation factor eIF-2B subunit gamma